MHSLKKIIKGSIWPEDEKVSGWEAAAKQGLLSTYESPDLSLIHIYTRKALRNIRKIPLQVLMSCMPSFRKQRKRDLLMNRRRQEKKFSVLP